MYYYEYSGGQHMRKITELLTEAAARAFESCGYDPNLATVAVSDRQDQIGRASCRERV